MLEKLKARKGEGGFTLIELLIVIIILAILAAIVIFAVGTTTKNASVSSCNSTVKSVETAVEAFKAQTGTYPAALTTLTSHTVTVTGSKEGPWLRTLPPNALTPGHHKYGITFKATTLKTTGNIEVVTSAGTVTADSATSCSAA